MRKRRTLGTEYGVTMRISVAGFRESGKKVSRLSSTGEIYIRGATLHYSASRNSYRMGETYMAGIGTRCPGTWESFDTWMFLVLRHRPPTSGPPRGEGEKRYLGTSVRTLRAVVCTMRRDATPTLHQRVRSDGLGTLLTWRRLGAQGGLTPCCRHFAGQLDPRASDRYFSVKQGLFTCSGTGGTWVHAWVRPWEPQKRCVCVLAAI